MTVQEFVNIDKDLQTVQDISDVNIIILIYLFIKHVLFIFMYLHVTMSVELKVYLFIWSHNFRFSMSLSLSPNSLYRQSTDCTEGGGLTREHCTFSVVLQSEFTLRQPQGVYSGFQHCPTRDEISFPLANQIAKKGQHFPKWKKNQQNSYKISVLKKFQNFNNL